MNLKKAKALRRLAECSTKGRPGGRLYMGRTRPNGQTTVFNAPFSMRGYYQHLKRIFNGT